MDVREAIATVIAGTDLSAEEIAEVFATIMKGDATPAQIGALLVGLRMKGESAAEIAGAATAMRACAQPLRCPDAETAVDTCGTGGDGSGSVNVSTIAAIVAAGAGARVAKHGNRAQSSRSGSADVLEALGVTIAPPIAVVERCLEEVGIGFLFAPGFHAATRHAAGPRRELGVRTIFNLLGPITNPAGVRNQIVGVFAARWCRPLALALARLGARRAFVVHGEGGIDEIAVRGVTHFAEWDESVGEVREREVTPADFGLAEVDPAGLAGGDAIYNAERARLLLAGESGAFRNAVVMEAAVALTAAGLCGDFAAGAERAGAAIDSGAARATLDRLVALSGQTE